MNRWRGLSVVGVLAAVAALLAGPSGAGPTARWRSTFNLYTAVQGATPVVYGTGLNRKPAALRLRLAAGAVNFYADSAAPVTIYGPTGNGLRLRRIASPALLRRFVALRRPQLFSLKVRIRQASVIVRPNLRGAQTAWRGTFLKGANARRNGQLLRALRFRVTSGSAVRVYAVTQAGIVRRILLARER